MPPTAIRRRSASSLADPNVWLFIFFGWDPTFERRIPGRTRILWTAAVVCVWTLFGAVAVLATIHMPPGQRWLPIALILAGWPLLNAIQLIMRSAVLERLAVEADQEAARRIQARLLPTTLPAPPGAELAAHYSPYLDVEGDYYDAFMLDASRLLVAVGDVSGKGTAAAMLTANAQALLHFAVAGGLPIERVAEDINAHLDRHTEAARYLTMVLAVFDLETRRLTWVNAGHNPPLVIEPRGQLVRLEGTGLPLGMLPAATYEARTLTLSPGSTMLFFTDGVTERSNRSGEMFGDERLAAALGAPGTATARDLVATVADAVEAFASGAAPDDDTTLLVLKVS